MREKEADMEKMRFELRKRRIIGIGDGIDDKMVSRVIDDLWRFNTEDDMAEIRLYINSGGGSVRPALRIFDAIRLSKVGVVGLVHGRCDSAAVTLLQACHRRLATLNSSFFLHFISSKFEFKFHESWKEVLKRLGVMRINNKELQLQTEVILSARSGLSLRQLHQKMKCGELYDKRITAQEALSIHLIDEIVDDYDLFSIPSHIIG